MECLKPLLPLIESGIKVYLNGQLIKNTTEHAKDVAIRSSVIAFGSITFLVFLVSAILMVFVDLGHQFESHEGVHFSGMMLSGIYLFTLGLFFLGISFGISKHLSAQEQKKKALEAAKALPYTALILFGEELLKQLIVKLSEKKE